MDQSSFLLFRDAAAPADCSRPHHILGKSLAFHLELRFSSSCRGELRTRWPPAQKGPGNCWGPSSPGRGTPSRAPSTWRPDYGLTSTPWPLNVPSSTLLKYPSPPLYPPEHPGWSPGASALARQMSLLHVPGFIPPSTTAWALNRLLGSWLPPSPQPPGGQERVRRAHPWWADV